MATSTTAEQTIDVVTPAAGESVTEGTILEWHVKVGDAIKLDETIVEISTDKVDVELPSPASGTVTEILVEEGDTVTVGQVIARIAVGEDADGAAAGNGAGSGRQASSGNGGGAAITAPAAQDGQGIPDGVKASPVAARAATAEGVDLTRVSGSGPGGRIVKSDVLGAASSAGTAEGNGSAGALAEKPAGAEQLKGGSAALARYMEQSRSIPTATSFRTLTVTTLDARRRELKGAGKRVSYTHLIAWAIARAAQDSAVMANHYAEIDGKPHRIEDGQVNLGLAVDVEKKDGTRTLMVPVITDAGGMRFDEFVAAYDALVDKARTNALTADDLQGGNITLTNPGGIGTIASVPRLMVGQGTIVATGSIAYPVGMGAIGEMIGAEKVMTMTSTYDHRIIQGAESGRFLAKIEEYLQGEHTFYEEAFAALSVELGPLPSPPAPAAAAAAAATETTSHLAPAAAPSEELLEAVQAASTLVTRFRSHGHLAARLDPLGSEPEGEPGLDPEAVGLTPAITAQIPAKILHMYVPGATLADALPHLRETYCGTIAYEIEHIASHRQRVWLREHIESGAFRGPLRSEEQQTLLKRLIEVDALERFMHKAYLGQHQFSIEGLDMTVPMLDELIQLSAAHGGREVVIGMAHRGRLNVLAHNLGRSYDTIFAEFEGASTLEAVTTIPQGGTGDVKYHHGTQGTYKLPDGGAIMVNLESNPSHLEYVSAVVEGATRAAQTTRHGPHAHQDTNAAVPIAIHGDASFPAQGVVAETLNLQALDGYKVGGTVHLIMNNQVGFTTDPDDARSTQWASDLAKGFDVPIIHVNADDVPACMSAVRLAFAFRQEFGHDVLIDLIGYRRFGHNESDEPAYTQPEMYAKIKGKKRVAELWAERLVNDGVVSKEEVDKLGQGVWDNLTILHQRLKAKIKAAAEHGGEEGTGEYQLDRSPSPDVETAVPADRLRRLGEEMLRTPDGFTVHPKLVKQLERRREALNDQQDANAPGEGEAIVQARPAIDWAHAEALAFASLLTEGTPIRLTGQDTERGHVQPAPHGAARREDRADGVPDPEPAGGAGAAGAAQQPALGAGVHGLRVWLQPGGAGDARAVGGAVRRLRELRAGDRRPVHRLGSGEVGPDFAADAAAAARLRGLGSRAFIGTAGAVPGAGGRGQHPRGEPDDAGAVLPPAAPSGEDRQAAPADRDDTEVAAAAAAGDQLGRRHGGEHAVSTGAGRAGGQGRAGHAAGAVHGQGLLRPRRTSRSAQARWAGGGTRGAVVSVPGGTDPGADEPVSEAGGGRVGAGGAAQHGSARAHVPAADADHARPDGLRLHRPPRARQPGRGLPGRAHRRTEPHRDDRDRPGRADIAVSA